MTSPTKVLIICSCFPPSRGGVERFVFGLIKSLQSEFKFEVSTTSRGLPKDRRREIYRNVEVVRSPERLHFLEAPLTPEIAFKALTSRYDIAHIHGAFPIVAELAILISWLRRKKIVVTHHFDAISRHKSLIALALSKLYCLLAGAFMRLADAVVVTTASYGRTSPALRLTSTPVFVIPVGLSTDGRKLEDDQEDNHKRKILFVGQLKWYKGLETLLRAFSLLVKHDAHDVELTIVGSGPEEGRVRLLSDALALNGKVRFVEHCSDEYLHSLYADSTIFVLPSISRREAFGTVLLEAMQHGKPVVATDIPGVCEVAPLGGVIVPPQNSTELYLAMKELLDNEAKRRELAAKAQMHIKRHDWNNIARKYSLLYRYVLSKQSGPRRRARCGSSL